MKYEEFRRQLGKAGLTNIMFANLVKIHPNSLTNYSKQGVVPSHWAITAMLMGLLAEHQIEFKDHLKSIDVEPNKVRGGAAIGKFGGEKQIGLLNLSSIESSQAQ